MSEKALRPVTAADTVVAIATPPGKGAIAVVRTSGPLSQTIVKRLFRTSAPLKPRVARYGTVVDEAGAAIDRGLAILFTAPHSYTGEDVLELHVHGSPVVAREVVRAALACGARNAAAGEFTRRAFLNGKMDLHEAAAVADVIDAETRSAARAAAANLGGGLAGEVAALRGQLTSMLEELSGAIDFPEEVPDPDRAALERGLAAIAQRLEKLRRDGERGRLVREGVTVAIVGPPNAGKSSLLNALLGEDRAIVSEIPGTTRDTIEESIVVDGVPVRLVDTAGIRSHADRLETEGIERTRRALDGARIALVVLDGSRPLDAEGYDVLAATKGREHIVFINKADLGTQIALQGAVVGSAFERASLDALRSAIAQLGWNGELPDLERPHLATLREFGAVNEALGALARARATLSAGEPSDLCAGELTRAFSALGHVCERVAAEEVLDGIFARFCIGK